jgi:hypothetical protein
MLGYLSMLAHVFSRLRCLRDVGQCYSHHDILLWPAHGIELSRLDRSSAREAHIQDVGPYQAIRSGPRWKLGRDRSRPRGQESNHSGSRTRANDHTA